MSHVIDALPEALRQLRGFGVLTDLDLYLVESLNRRVAAGQAPASVLLVCALASRVINDAHICLRLGDCTPAAVAALGSEGVTAETLPEAARGLVEALAEMRASALLEAGQPLIGEPGSPAPFILQDDRIYLRRYWLYEASVAERLAGLSRDVGSSLTAEQVAAVLDGMGLEGKQREAAAAGLTRRLAVITGGPGTGKTYVAAKVLAALLQADEVGGHVPVIRMAAPTGKAAARMEESVRQLLESMGDEIGDRLQYVEDACTIDRLLGYVPNSHYFRHNADNPLTADVVVVDEASMIDLPEMAKLLDAMGSRCRLVLLGDMHQLASVEPGAVMRDICAAEMLQASVVELDQNQRSDAGGPADQLAKAVNQTRDADGAAAVWSLLGTLADAQYAESKRVVQHALPSRMVDGSGNVAPAFAAELIRGFADFLATDEPAAAFAALKEFRVLCALRRGQQGVEAVNRLIERTLSRKGVDAQLLPEALRASPRLEARGEAYSHRVILVTRNDYSLDLRNGDVGVVLPDAVGSARMVTWFEGRATPVPYSLLPDHETGFAMTIHKSQGSEFGQVLVVLPAQETPVLTRELVYTAITRTRGGVMLWCNEGVFKAGISRSVERGSGLLQQLSQTS